MPISPQFQAGSWEENYFRNQVGGMHATGPAGVSVDAARMRDRQRAGILAQQGRYRDAQTGLLQARTSAIGNLGSIDTSFRDPFGGSSPAINFQVIQDLLNQARQRRATEFAPGVLGRVNKDIRQGDVQFSIDKLKDLSQGPSGEQFQALQSQGLRGIEQGYLSSLRDLRALGSDRSLPTGVASSRRADLLKERLRSEKDLQQGLIISDLDRRNQTLGLLGQITGTDIQRQQLAQRSNIQSELQERLNRLGRPEQAAELRLQSEQSNLQAQLQAAQQRRAADEFSRNLRLQQLRAVLGF